VRGRKPQNFNAQAAVRFYATNAADASPLNGR